MPQRRTAIKDLRRSHTRHMRNLDIKSDLKKTVKRFISATSAKGGSASGGKATDAPELLKALYKKMDKAAKRKVMHKKTAARRKSRFAKLLISTK